LNDVLHNAMKGSKGSPRRIEGSRRNNITRGLESNSIMGRIPTKTDFPASLTLSISPPPGPNPRSTNILLILHGLGDTITPFASFARALNLPETTCIALQAPAPLPFELPGFHWGDDIVFEDIDPAGFLDSDPGFSRATRLLVRDVILSVLIDKLGYKAREILIFGFAQGASVALAAGVELCRERARSDNEETDGELGGIVAIGGVLPLSAIKEDGRMRKVGSPVLLVGGRVPESAVSEAGVRRTQEAFQHVEVVRWAGKRGDGMPQNRDQMLPIMQFFARRLRSRSGVPEGSVEIGA
jgi:predicted esterase